MCETRTAYEAVNRRVKLYSKASHACASDSGEQHGRSGAIAISCNPLLRSVGGRTASTRVRTAQGCCALVLLTSALGRLREQQQKMPSLTPSRARRSPGAGARAVLARRTTGPPATRPGEAWNRAKRLARERARPPGSPKPRSPSPTKVAAAARRAQGLAGRFSKADTDEDDSDGPPATPALRRSPLAASNGSPERRRPSSPAFPAPPDSPLLVGSRRSNRSTHHVLGRSAMPPGCKNGAALPTSPS